MFVWDLRLARIFEGGQGSCFGRAATKASAASLGDWKVLGEVVLGEESHGRTSHSRREVPALEWSTQRR